MTSFTLSELPSLQVQILGSSLVKRSARGRVGGKPFKSQDSSLCSHSKEHTERDLERDTQRL